MEGRAACPTHDLIDRAALIHSGATIEIAARRGLKPYSQGEFSRLCALLAPINGLRLALADIAPLSRADCRDLYDAGIAYLHRKGGLHETMLEGTGARRRIALARFLAREASVIATNCQIEIERTGADTIRTINDAFAWIVDSILLNRPVLIAAMGGINHFSVVAGITPRTLQLFDSAGVKFLRRSSCGLHDGFHQIHPRTGLIRIAVHQTG